jgi:hypothetical protein
VRVRGGRRVGVGRGRDRARPARHVRSSRTQALVLHVVVVVVEGVVRAVVVGEGALHPALSHQLGRLQLGGAVEGFRSGLAWKQHQKIKWASR